MNSSDPDLIDFDGTLSYQQPTLDQVGEELIDRMWKVNQDNWNRNMRIVFDLVYVSHFEASYVDSLSPIERDWFYTELIERKEAETRAMQDSFKGK